LHCFVGQGAAGSKGNVKTDAALNRLGLDSAMLVYLMIELEEQFDPELSPGDLYDCPTVNDLSRYLAERLATPSAG
jgi:acyl carrier protein